MNHGQTLIDRAKEKAGSYYKLWKLTGLAQSTLSDIRAGKRQLPIDKVPVMSDLAGLNVDESIHRVMIEQVKSPLERQRLIEILGKGGAAGVVALLGFCYSDTSNACTLQRAELHKVFNNLYIVEYVKRVFALVSHRASQPGKHGGNPPYATLPRSHVYQ